MNTAVQTQSSPASEARAAKRVANVLEKFNEIKAKLGTKCLKSERIYLDLSPNHLELVRKHGVKLATGYYSLEHYFGEKKPGEAPTPLPEGTKVPKERAAPAIDATAAMAASQAAQKPKVETAPAKPSNKRNAKKAPAQPQASA